MPKEIKEVIDRIVDSLAQESSIAAVYAEWYRQWSEILKTYDSDVPEASPLSEHPQFKSIKNTVIAEALKLDNHSVMFSDTPPNSSTPAAAVSNLVRTLTKLFESKNDEMAVHKVQHERKALRKEKQKKISQGHAEDDQEPKQKY